ncbi:MAG: hypothetical protein D6717_10830 [Gammaproteobacteria bacterium]|nr:MAG: hypothetical protein D6717_10830 [Gammaproteobacteria bacterium]
MAITPASASALAGIQAGFDGVRRNAAEIASKDQLEGTARRPLYQPLVENITYSLQARASVKVIQTEDRMLGSLLDVKA